MLDDKGKEVRTSEDGYCQWALRHEQPSGALKEFAQCLKSEPKVATPKRAAREEPSSSSKRRRTDDMAAVTIAEGKDDTRLRWHLTRGGLFKQRSGGKLVSCRPLAPDEEAYIDKIRVLTKTSGGILDDEIRETPKAFWPNIQDLGSHRGESGGRPPPRFTCSNLGGGSLPGN